MSTYSRPTTITLAKLRDILASIRGAQPITFTALTVPEGRKAPFPIRKLVRLNAMTGCRYANAAAKHGLTAQDERAWGEHSESAVVTRTAKDGTEVAYLPVQLNHASRPLYLVPSPTGRLTVVPASTVLPYLRPERPFAVSYKDYALSSLASVNVLGHRYRIRPEPATA